MIFHFLQYVNPVWYFNLAYPGVGPFFDIDPEALEPEERFVLLTDDRYPTREGMLCDLAYQAAQKGLIDGGSRKKKTISNTDIGDNYRFLRKYYHPLWSWYVLLIRLFTLHNPFKEISAFWSQRKTPRFALYQHIYPHENAYRQFESALLKQQPLVSVIIPTLNRYAYLADVLKDLEQQDYSHFEVIVVDQSEPFQPDFYQHYKLRLVVLQQAEKALWLARNVAIRQSKADYLLLFDDDSRVDPDWISQHIKCLDYFQADISSGVSISLVGAKVPESYSYFRLGDQVDTGNVLIHRRVFKKTGLFDRQFERQRMGDGEFGLRAYLAGFKNISNPLAQRLHLKVSEGGLRQMGSWDAFRPKKWWAPRPVPSVLYLYRTYFPKKWVLWGLIAGVLPSIMPYRFKRSKSLMIVGSFISILLSPLLLWQITRSWKEASKKLTQGPFIEYL